MPIFSLLYGSISLLPPTDADAAIADIVAVSQAWNRDHGITGVLIAADGRFAQLLEGEEAEVRLLMTRILGDPRHTGVQVALEEQRPRRYVPAWSMAYFGPSSFVGNHIVALRAGSDATQTRRAAQRLIALLVAFAQDAPDRVDA